MTHHGAVGKAIRAYNESFNSFFLSMEAFISSESFYLVLCNLFSGYRAFNAYVVETDKHGGQSNFISS